MSQVLAFKTALGPNNVQGQALASHVGAARYAYNWSLNHVQKNWEAVKADPNVEYVKTNAYALRKALNTVKAEVAPWYAENSKEAFATGTANAAKALQNWFDSRSGKRARSSHGVSPLQVS